MNVDISAPDGLYHPWFQDVQLKIYGLTKNISAVTADSHSMRGWNLESGVLTLPGMRWGSVAHRLRIDLK
jgi:hypothetical protein